MLSLKLYNLYANRFREVSGQNPEDWSNYEQLTQEQRQNPKDLRDALDHIIRCEMLKLLEEGKFRATYLRDLALLLTDLRADMS
jgi:hypothetical protein